MLIDEFDFELPEGLIASFPLENRDNSRLLHYSRSSELTRHRKFNEIVDILNEGDILVRNTSKVLALRFKIQDTQNSPAEILLTENLDTKKTLWSALVKPGKKIKESKKSKKQFLIANTIPINIWRDGDNFFVEFNSTDDFEIAVRDYGLMPLPPYMKRDATALDKERYQTIYAQDHQRGASIAAPTAGLHFTDRINSAIINKGVEIIDTCLHVGLGTFMPIRTDEVQSHEMHEEYYEISPTNWQKILNAKKQKRRVIAVGSTSTRVLETLGQAEDYESPEILSGKTKIYIYPGYQFRIIDGLITNFHLPKSTLILMISAFLGSEKVKEIYAEAIKQEYRFYSYGDCCFFDS
jgi:S-adenosylmethionine:tRNA ribosyltransferase-isomerase